MNAEQMLSIHIDEINLINVFPVSDKDTGTNLYLSIKNTTPKIVNDNQAASYFTAFVDEVFKNASGNSGFIFWLFLKALSQLLKTNDDFEAGVFFIHLEKAAKKARKNMDDFVPGTLLSYIIDLANSTKALDIKSWDEKCFIQIKKLSNQSLKNTTSDNPKLKNKYLIDAGALGLHFWLMGLIEGLCQLVSKDRFKIKPNNHHLEITNPLEHIDANEKPNLRYCLQITLEAAKKNHALINKTLNDLGDSQLKLVDDKIIRHHIHTEDLQKLTTLILPLATIQDIKIEDMLMQHYAWHSKDKVAVVSDSSADIPISIHKKNNIHFIPISIFCQGHKFLDGLTINQKTLLNLAKTNKSYPSTAAPPIGVITKTFEYLSKNHQHVIAITVSEKMSSTYQVFKKATLAFDNVSIVDSKTNSGAHGFILEEIINRLNRGDPFEKVKSNLESIRKSTDIFVLVNNFATMVKSGRISAPKAWLAKLINLKPIVGIINGKGQVIKKTLSEKAQQQAILEIIIKKHLKAPIKQLRLLHVANEQGAISLAKKIERALGIKTNDILQASSAICLHAGPGTLAVAINQQ